MCRLRCAVSVLIFVVHGEIAWTHSKFYGGNAERNVMDEYIDDNIRVRWRM